MPSASVNTFILFFLSSRKARHARYYLLQFPADGHSNSSTCIHWTVRTCLPGWRLYLYISIYALYSFTHVFTGHFFLRYLPDAWFAAPLCPVAHLTKATCTHVAGDFTLFADCTSHVFHSQILGGGECTWVGGSGWGRWHDSTFLTPLLDVALHKRVSGCSGPVTPFYYCVIFCCEFPSAAVPGRLTWRIIHLFANWHYKSEWWLPLTLQMPVKHTNYTSLTHSNPKQFRRLYFVIYEQNLWHL